MSFIKLPRDKYRHGIWENNSSPIIVYYDMFKFRDLKFTKSKDNTNISYKYKGIVYDIDFKNGIELNGDIFYIYKYVSCDDYLSRYINHFVFENDVYIHYKEELYYYNNKKNLYSDEKNRITF